jgi:GGDEF domain-containing protein
LAQRLHAALTDEPWPHAESGLPLSASVGVAEWRPGEGVSEWVARADAAMYANKQHRRQAA